jgi:uncharacterized protein
MQTILITGASGTIGRHLTKLFQSKGYRVIHLSRHTSNEGSVETFVWNVEKKIIDDRAIAQADYVIHLAGAGIAEKRWTKKRKEEIVNSRVNSAQLLVDSIIRTNKKLKAFISASAIGYYGAVTADTIFTEESEPGNDFLANCCRLWEKSVDPFSSLGIRTVKIRTGIVLEKHSGILSKMLLPVKLGIGSALGTGKQYVPWIHIDDICGIYLKAVEDTHMNGAYNAVASEQITNKELIRTIAKTMHKPFFLPNIPAFILKIIFGEISNAFLEGSPVSGSKIKNAGYEFKFKTSEEALQNLLKIEIS